LQGYVLVAPKMRLSADCPKDVVSADFRGYLLIWWMSAGFLLI